MYFAKIALLALPFIGLASTKPVMVEVEKRATALDVVNELQSAIAGPITTLKTANVSSDDAQTALTSIKSAITDATSAIGSATASKRDLVAFESRQADDLAIVGSVLAQVIQDIVEAVEGLADDLKGLPLINVHRLTLVVKGAIIIDIDFGLNTLLLGVELVLAGVVEILRGLLSGVADLLQSLGNGLLAGLIFA
ncbi:hypothetical protein L486_05588 [Kwoniella mangroviensis CBS 10435]|uniref:Uncharacterized protein n=1 Tax=Kwoniella mangroviensis CBS 10435 TaxID=1331196 RepID=A0A1B9IMZ4_9TREE|nr:uncharacterized protein I203_07236 [Kwoniella mangroviensis CBS 8507]OCF56734.1 hypothetical protein L486_05588 [Kwoniella mangroviensis CBS 10435]OCF63540.1 hypothetical protein I203_07236 [Kwoniella mangroviensis CBS 8507]OCF75307.1 hypothetical protein I204_04160 [Kwoniella mangroviensis CBS 8886]